MDSSAQTAFAPAVTAEMDAMVREQLLDRRGKLETARSRGVGDDDVLRLLGEVDAALERFETGTFGICEECLAPIEPERLLADPLMRVCLGDLTAKQRQALEDDLELASSIQNGLLPKPQTAVEGWEVDFIYKPAGIVSGDYVDVIPHGDEIYFILGDVSGKGMAASLLMSSMHGMFHSLIPLGLPLCEMVVRANRLLCESTLANQFATLVVGRADRSGTIEICNAGHLPPVVVRESGHEEIDSAGLPLGMFYDVNFESSSLSLGPDETLVLFSDGVTEATDTTGREFGVEGLLRTITSGGDRDPASLVRRTADAVGNFSGAAGQADDLTVMALRFAGGAD